MPMTVPCGQCSACRLERSRQWAIRCVHEASLYDHNAFITLTYNDDHLPHDRSLNLKHAQDFLKRLRKRFGPGIRFYGCGEYGEQLGRPHYHMCLFNHDFHDKVLWKEERGVKLYRSEEIEKLWTYGYSTTGGVTFQSAAYVARYIMKKITGDIAADHYEYIDPETGEVFDRKPEYTHMSLKPGIGSRWINKYTSDVYPTDFVVLNGVKMKPPKYYDRSFEVMDPDAFHKVRSARLKSGKKREADNTPARLKVKEKVLNAKLSQLKRSLA